VVSGLVRQASEQPLAGATVRIRASQHSTHTDSQGRFTLVGFDPTFRLRITGWADGHYVGGRTVWPWNREIVLVLDSYTVADDSSYDWIAPAVDDRTLWEDVKVRARLDPTGALAPDTLFFKAAEGLRLGCRDCHGEVIYDQWAASAHALGFSNPRFASMYNGTDLSGVGAAPPLVMATIVTMGVSPFGLIPPSPTMARATCSTSLLPPATALPATCLAPRWRRPTVSLRTQLTVWMLWALTVTSATRSRTSA
jgi:hypothetical protein